MEITEQGIRAAARDSYYAFDEWLKKLLSFSDVQKAQELQDRVERIIARHCEAAPSDAAPLSNEPLAIPAPLNGHTFYDSGTSFQPCETCHKQPCVCNAAIPAAPTPNVTCSACGATMIPTFQCLACERTTGLSTGKATEPAGIHSDVFQALVALVAVLERGINPAACLEEAKFVVQEVTAGRMNMNTVTPYPAENEHERVAIPAAPTKEPSKLYRPIPDCRRALAESVEQVLRYGFGKPDSLTDTWEKRVEVIESALNAYGDRITVEAIPAAPRKEISQKFNQILKAYGVLFHDDAMRSRMIIDLMSEIREKKLRRGENQ